MKNVHNSGKVHLGLTLTSAIWRGFPLWETVKKHLLNIARGGGLGQMMWPRFCTSLVYQFHKKNVYIWMYSEHRIANWGHSDFKRKALVVELFSVISKVALTQMQASFR